MKKLINKVENVEIEMIQGIAKAHPDILEQLPGHTILVRKNKKTDKVALISGGGSGHEPAHGGFVGYGMLDAAVAGAVFTSPTPDQVKAAIDAVVTPAGVLLVIKNYTGDVMNFEMAGELAEMDGIPVKSVIMNDDVAVKDSLYTTGRRGVAGTIFIHKIAGAKAEEGASLEEVARVAEKVIANTRTMGMSLTACTVPAAGKPGFEIADDEVEIGMGIHGEPGTHREMLRTSDEFVDLMISKGARYAWYFNYMPVGSGAVEELIPTPEQRTHMYNWVRKMRNSKTGKPMFVIDFQDDGEYVGGCIARGRNYFHINSAGDIEPCVFIHYSDSNIREHTLIEALKRPLFQAYWHGQPFNNNHLRPCPMLENPQCLRKMIKDTGAKSTDLLAPEDVETLCARCDKFAAQWAPVAQELWESREHPHHKTQYYRDTPAGKAELREKK